MIEEVFDELRIRNVLKKKDEYNAGQTALLAADVQKYMRIEPDAKEDDAHIKGNEEEVKEPPLAPLDKSSSDKAHVDKKEI